MRNDDLPTVGGGDHGLGAGSGNEGAQGVAVIGLVGNDGLRIEIGEGGPAPW
jgi:hypothetical protein